MRKTACALVLIATICFQGTALAKQILRWDRGGDASHSLMHSGNVAHHHHHDGSVHEDPSKESTQHVQDDCHASVAAIPPSALQTLEAEPARWIAQREPRSHDSAYIEGLKRPPRAMA